MVDKNLFLYDLAIVTIMKNNALYVKEWLDYHLLAGADHFYIYDNGSTDNFSEVIQPYVDNGVVTKLNANVWQMGIPSFNDAVKKFRFQCRYMAFLDSDEYIFPRSKATIREIADEVFNKNPNTAALGVNWLMFGSSGLEKADYTRGVLDRFIHCAPNIDRHTKAITNPRRIKFFFNPHFAVYFEGYSAVNENGQIFDGPFNESKTGEKIRIHHYYTKSLEEFEEKVKLSNQVGYKRDMRKFKVCDRNEIFDDAIVKYRDAGIAALTSKRGGDMKRFLTKKSTLNV